MLFDCKFTSWRPSWLVFLKNYLCALHDQNDVDGWVESKHAIHSIQCLSRLRTFCKEIIAFKPLLWKIFARIK